MIFVIKKKLKTDNETMLVLNDKQIEHASKNEKKLRHNI